MGGLYSGLGPSWVRIEPSRARLKSLLGRPGTSWGHPEASWESPGGHVWRIFEDFTDLVFGTGQSESLESDLVGG